MPALDELEVGDVLDPEAELGGVPARREGAPFAPPHDGPQVAHGVHLGQDLPQAAVHLVAHGVVPLGAVVGDHRDGPVHLEADQVAVLFAQAAHGVAPLVGSVGPDGSLPRGGEGWPKGGRSSCSLIGVKGGCTVWRRCQLAPSTTSEWPLM